MPHVFLALVQRVLRFPLRRPGLITASILAGAVVAGATAAPPPPSSKLAGSAVDVIPADAAFVSATLRGREQLERITKSNAFKSLKALPGIARALDSLEEQRTMPGSPIAMIDTFMEFPENEQALDLIRDMVATDTFVYGDPSCIVFLELLQKLQRVQQFTGIATAPLQENGGLLPLFEQDDEDGDEEAEENDVGAAGRRVRARTVARRATDAAEAIPAESVRQRALVKVLAENLDLIVVPDVVWGFRTTKPDAAKSQLKRIEVLAKLVIQANPDLADSMSRRKVAGGEVVTFTLDGQRLPWDSIRRELAGEIGDVDGLDRVIERLQDLDIVVALGLIGDRVILSIGDSIEHLGKLAVPGSGNKSLLTLPALAPLVAHADRPITGISYVSRDLAAANAGSSRDVEPIAQVVGDFFAANDLPAEAADETEKWLEDAARKLSARMPVPDAWLSFSFMTDDGYEGYAWDWAKNQPTDASARLGLLRHAGGDPLAVLVSRIRSDDTVLDDVAAFLRTGWSIVRRHLVPRAGDEAQEMAGKFAEHFVPLGEKFMAILREKIVPSLADGQVGLVLDAKSRSERPQAALPAASEPLPLPEPAIVLPLADAKLFRSGMSDLFALGDDLVATVRNVDPDAVPAGYEIPDPDKQKTESGTLWSFRLPHSGLDDQVRPTIGVGDRAAAFTFLPSQAGRILADANLQTAADVSAFDSPLSGAAAVDFSRLVAAIRPWVVYLARYAGVHAASGGVDADRKLTADVETPEAREAIAHAGVILEAISCLRAAAAETSVKDGALVTHWRALVRDLPSK